MPIICLVCVAHRVVCDSLEKKFWRNLSTVFMRHHGDVRCFWLRKNPPKNFLVAVLGVRHYAVHMRESSCANDEFFAHQRCRTLPITATVTTIAGYPTKLKIFQTKASRYWQVRCFFSPRVLIRSLRTTNKRDAIQQAKEFYEQELIKRSGRLTMMGDYMPTSHSVSMTVSLLLQNELGRLGRDEITRESYLMTKSRCQGPISQFFDSIPVERIDRVAIERFIAHMSKQNIRASTVKAYLQALKKVMATALHQEWIDRKSVV